MNDLTENQSNKLDQILKLFGNEESLDADKVLEIEPNDRMASALLDILVTKGLIVRVGEAIGRNLPIIINIEPKAELFKENGGFTAQFHQKRATSSVVNIYTDGNHNVINAGNDNTLAVGKHTEHNEQIPFIEADLKHQSSGRRNHGYSDKNPTEIVDGQPVYVVGFGNNPIVYWQLDWQLLLVLHNNSSYPAYNVKIEMISEQKFTRLGKLERINNLQPGSNFELEAQYESRIESTHVEADALLEHKIPEALNGLTLQVTYRDEKHRQHITLVTIEDGEVVSIKK